MQRRTKLVFDSVAVFDFSGPTQYHEISRNATPESPKSMNALTSQAVYEQLLKKVTTGEYPPGMRLSDQALADEMEVGAPAIHDAVRRGALPKRLEESFASWKKKATPLHTALDGSRRAFSNAHIT